MPAVDANVRLAPCNGDGPWGRGHLALARAVRRVPACGAPNGGSTLVVSRCCPIRIVKLSISLPDDQVGFLDAYARSHGIKSRSGAIQAALRLLRTSQLSDDYASAWAEWSEDAEPWDRTANDGTTR